LDFFTILGFICNICFFVAPVAPAAAPVGAAALPPAAGSMIVMPADYINIFWLDQS
jgi:hypothetical protein